MRRRRTGRGAFLDVRLSIDPQGDWRSYTATIPKDCEVLGTVTLGESDTGALVRLDKGRGLFLKVKDGAVSVLDQRKVERTLLSLHESGAGGLEMIKIEDWEKPSTTEGKYRP